MAWTHDDLAFAHRLADAADAIALRHFASAGTAWRAKSDGSPVSLADEQIERTLRSAIQREHPADGVLGEEFGSTGRGRRRRWVVDAIDGTASFLAGQPEWSTLIALEADDTVVLGLVTAPALGRRWWAARGTGAWTQATGPAGSAPVQRVTITGADSLGDADVGIWPPPARLSPADRAVAARLAAAARTTRPDADWTDTARSPGPVLKPSTGTGTGTCHGALLVATGQLDAFLLLGAGPWDIAALVPIIEEAGGAYAALTTAASTDTTASALFANPALQPQIIDVTNCGR
ncbi:inositol monophosphatase family protein [Streptacidiphilus fuscans]|uniref:Inositol monophosphatase n=1 Tax=Streptacidiphilus fuscans TaxID=2789292 RepID=A0A931B116_9ACTN|nr:inositol monophosphatase family protein [Streptacidiphilus fuscans]MBF9067192.1 inositol monophosphatase [Streptacidiphilus fuscans]